MLMISTNLRRLITLLVLFLSAAGGLLAGDWPVNFNVDLASGFGDYRSRHFHFGIDIRTGGVTGKPVVSPVDGYVWRVRTAYTGYGKALYIRGKDGYTYVFAHLADFAPKIDGPLKEAQLIAKRYYQDIFLPEDSITVRKGEEVAYSGQTGIGAPHLHFEKRVGDIPLNPLSHGYSLKDVARPIFTRVGFQQVDDRTVFPNGTRKMFLTAKATEKPGVFRLDTVLYLNTPVGLLADCYDMLRPDGMKQAVYHLAVYVDDKLIHESRLDSTAFDTDPSVSLEYDLVEATAKRKHVRRLFREEGNTFNGCRPTGPHEGVLGAEGMLDPGPHKVKIVGEDAAGNKSELQFTILWGPPENLYALDSLVKVAADTTDFYFTPSPDVAAFAVDSAVVYVNRGSVWSWTPDAKVQRLADNRLKARAIGFMTYLVPLQLRLFTKEGGVIVDTLFNGIQKYGGKIKTAHEVTDEGLLVTIQSFEKQMHAGRIEFYYRDTLLGTEYPQTISMEKYVCFVKPQEKYRRIDRYHAVLSRDTMYTGLWSDTVNIQVVGLDSVQQIPVDEHFSINLHGDACFRPMFVELARTFVINRSKLQLNSDHYRILPKTFPLRRNLTVSYDFPQDFEQNKNSGLCWLDEEANKWVWMDNKLEDGAGVLTAAIGGGGSFAAVFDYVPPTVSRLTVSDGVTIQNRRPAINFMVKDTLSGIGDDRNIIVELDGEWLIPEYDPESGMVQSRPLTPLAPGKHHLGIQVTDRAGNLTEQYLNFFVKATQKERGKS